MRMTHCGGRWWVPLLTVLTLGAAGRDVPLVDAVKKADMAAVHALLQQPVDVNAAEPDGTTALHWAVHQDESGNDRPADSRWRHGNSRKPLWCRAALAGLRERERGDNRAVAECGGRTQTPPWRTANRR